MGVKGEETQIQLRFDSGTLVVDGADRSIELSAALRWDERVKRWRAPACAYRRVVTDLTRRKMDFKDAARDYFEFEFRPQIEIEPRPYQREGTGSQRYVVRHGGKYVSLFSFLSG